MSGPTRGAVIGALIYEGLADTPEAAEELAAGGQIEFAPCHHVHAVGPMAGIISPSMPVFIVQNDEFGNTVFATQNEGLGRVLRYGTYGPKVILELKWMETVLYPALQRALSQTGPLDLRAMTAQALHMGDECHNRNKAGTSAHPHHGPALVETSDAATAAAVLRFMDGNDHFYLNLSMPAMKAMLEPAEGIRGCTVVTVMARNGTDWGVRVSATGKRWFTAPSPYVQGLWLPGYSAADPTPTSATAPSPRPAASAASPWPARPLSSSSWAARHRTRSIPADDVRDLRRQALGLQHSHAELPRFPRGRGHAAHSRDRHNSPSQRRHRAQNPRRRHRRRRPGRRADGLLRAGV